MSYSSDYSVDPFEYSNETADRFDTELNGNRLVSLKNFWEQIKTISQHKSLFNCGINDCTIIKEFRRGFNSVLSLRCSMCNAIFKLHTVEPFEQSQTKSDMGINYAAILGCINIGIGYTQLQEQMAILDVPCMSSSTFNDLQKDVGKDMEAVSQKLLKEAVDEEVAIAIEQGNLDQDGFPLLTVVADGCWSHRSYRTKYTSLSGSAAIVGYNSKKVLWIGNRNKYCIICNRYTDKEHTPEHDCNINYAGASTAMESSILLEGFQKSEALYGVRYKTLIADGDSSVYNKILKANPYRNTHVEKIECKNHVLRNYRNKLTDLSNNTKFNVSSRKLLKNEIERMWRDSHVVIKKHATIYRSNLLDKGKIIADLASELKNIPYHVFGNHDNCTDFYKKSNEPNKIDLLIQTSVNMFDDIVNIQNRLAILSKSLVHNVNSNIVEQFHSIVAKYVGGKRINFSLGRSYKIRCLAATVHHNTKRNVSSISKTIFNRSPNPRIKHLQTLKAIENERRKPKAYRKRLPTQQDGDYGDNAERPDLSPEDFNIALQKHTALLKLYQDDRVNIERTTTDQADNVKWNNIRKILLTASNFGLVCRARKLQSAVRTVLYSKIFTTAMAYGKIHEERAVSQLEKQEGVQIDKCGIFIDAIHSCLAATPDGLIGTDGLVEIKCPSSAANLDFAAAVREGKLKYIKYNKKMDIIIGLKKNHRYYYQIQGQLSVADRQFCLFCVWTGAQHTMHVEKILRDNILWNEIVPKLLIFYKSYLVPEIIDPRVVRNLPIRDHSKQQ